MPFETLLGNEQLKTDLSRSIQRGQFSHCYLISGPEGSGKHTLARLLAAAILCPEKEKPCLKCRQCRRVLEGRHPDLITWEDREHQKIPVKMLREVFRPEVFIKPNESEHKLFLIPQELGVEGQNALLKVLEEPPAYAVFLLLTDNPEKLLPTIRSRCRELKLLALGPELEGILAREFPQARKEDLQAAVSRSGGFLGQARSLLAQGSALPAQTEGLLRYFESGDPLELVGVLAPMEKWKREALIPLLGEWEDLLAQALICRSGGQAVSPHARALAGGKTAPEIFRLLEAVKKASLYAQANVSPGAVCGYLSWELRC